MRGKAASAKTIFFLCIACFLAGTLFSGQIWTRPSNHENALLPARYDCDHKRKLIEGRPGDVMEEVAKTHQAVKSLDKAVSSLEMELTAARTRQTGGQRLRQQASIPKAFVVIGINTAFSSKRRRDSIRQTWLPKGNQLKELEKERGIVIRFVIGHSPTPGGIHDKELDEEEAEHKDFLRLDHVEGYHELSTKTRLYFSAIISMWDADFYVKVDDDVHLNLGMLLSTLAKYRSQPRVYIGCMKSGPVLYQKGVKYHEAEHWKFGEEGNKYFRHATGQIYAISKDLATYISINWPVLHRYANEDVSLGSWLLGLEVKYVDERSMCCGTPPVKDQTEFESDKISLHSLDCNWKARTGNVCVASFDWSCSGICKSVERMKEIHKACGEGDEAIWNVDL